MLFGNTILSIETSFSRTRHPHFLEKKDLSCLFYFPKPHLHPCLSSSRLIPEVLIQFLNQKLYISDVENKVKKDWPAFLVDFILLQEAFEFNGFKKIQVKWGCIFSFLSYSSLCGQNYQNIVLRLVRKVMLVIFFIILGLLGIYENGILIWYQKFRKVPDRFLWQIDCKNFLGFLHLNR